jgi:hypothetical protein
MGQMLAKSVKITGCGRSLPWRGARFGAGFACPCCGAGFGAGFGSGRGAGFPDAMSSVLSLLRRWARWPLIGSFVETSATIQSSQGPQCGGNMA